MKKNTRKQQRDRGFTLLLAALVASITLALGIATYSIAIKQLTLSGIGRDSQFAFYAADTMAECALFWDVRNQHFSTTTPPTTITCNGETAHVTTVTEQAASWTSSVFTFQMDFNNDCAKVTFTKEIKKGAVSSTIHSDGLNVPCAAATTDPHALQRSIELHY